MTRLVILCLTWMVLSGLVAYLADNWGRKLGKKRLNLLGLRPKHTAIAIICATGALMSFFSFALLLGVDANLRKALLHWDQINEQNQTLLQEQKRLMADTERQRALSVQEKARTAGLQKRNGVLMAEARQSGARLQEANVALTAAQRRTEEARGSLTATTAHLHQTRSSLDRANGQLQATHGRLQTATLSLKKTNVQLEAQNRQVARVESMVLSSTAQMLSSERQADAARRAADLALHGNLVAKAGDELVRVVIPPRPTLQAAREDVTSALNAARVNVQRRAQDKGAAYALGTDFVRLARHAVRAQGARGAASVVITPSRLLDAVATQLTPPQSQQPGGVVLRVVAKANAVAGETVTVDFELYRNHVIFDKNQQIAEVVLRQGESKEDIMQDITDGLRAVRKTAREQGLMPSDDDTVTAVPFSQIADVYNTALEFMNKYGQRNVPIHIVAAEDTWTAGPLKLKLTVDRHEKT